MIICSLCGDTQMFTHMCYDLPAGWNSNCETYHQAWEMEDGGCQSALREKNLGHGRKPQPLQALPILGEWQTLLC